MFPGLDLYYTDHAQHLKMACEHLDDRWQTYRWGDHDIDAVTDAATTGHPDLAPT